MRSSALVAMGLAPFCSALLATSGSPCESLCNSSAFNGLRAPSTELTCSDAAYNSTAVGTRYQSCVSCLQNSTSTDSSKDASGVFSDQGAFLYNTRATLSACLFSFPNATSSTSSNACQISTACEPLAGAFRSGLLNVTTPQYAYCGAGLPGESVVSCVQCLQGSADQSFLANFLIGLEAGCQQKPTAGQVLKLSGTVFSKSQITIGAPAPPTSPEASNSTTKISIGAIIGIAFVCVLVLVAIGTVLLIRRRQRMRREGPHRLKVVNEGFNQIYGSGTEVSDKSPSSGKTSRKMGLRINTSFANAR